MPKKLSYRSIDPGGIRWGTIRTLSTCIDPGGIRWGTIRTLSTCIDPGGIRWEQLDL